MARYNDLAQPVSLAPSPQAARAIDVLRATFMTPSSPSPEMGTEQHMRNGADVVAGLMLDRRSSELFQSSIDQWLNSGGLTPFQSPLPLPPRQEAQLGRRMAALVAQRKAKLPFSNGPVNPQEPTMPLAAVTQEPSRDRLHAIARTDLATWLAGTGDRTILKSDDGAVPPKAVRTACQRGLDLAPKFGGPGLTEGAKARARSMIAGNAVSQDNLGRMVNFFSRHQQNRADPSASEPTPGAVAWLIWGGDAGKKWAESQAGGTEKSGEPKWKRQGLVGPGGAWATAKRKAKGKGDAYARKIYATMVGKSAGAGSRGGHVIGTTASGKPIYAASHETYHAVHTAMGGHGSQGEKDEDAVHAVRQAHPDWTRQDHITASEKHESAAASMAGNSASRQATKRASEAHGLAAMYAKKSLAPRRSSAMSARSILATHLSKGRAVPGAGAGSRGGRIIGHYRSGRPIYASGWGHGGEANKHPAYLDAKLRDGANHKLDEPERKAAVQKLHKDAFKDHSPAMHEAAARAHKNQASMLFHTERGSAKHKGHIAAFHFHQQAAFASKKPWAD